MKSQNLRNVCIELSAILFLAIASGLIAKYVQDFLLFLNEKWRTQAIIICFLPILFFYIIARQLLRPFAASIFTVLIFFILAETNRVKQALTGEPLGWNDISSASNISVMRHYISGEHLFLIALFFSVIALMIKVNQFCAPTKSKALISFSCLVILAPVTFYPYLEKINDPLSQKVKYKLAELGVDYILWNWPDNVRMSGLPLHLIQTSRRDIPPPPTSEEISHFSALKSREKPVAHPPKNVIFILCEACWHDDIYFKKEFAPLDKFSFEKFPAISPVYGGGTVNSSFELLTGLPSQGHLTGIIYQEYASILKDDAAAFPRALRARGYTTIAAHNHYRKFWNRDIINPKLGFDRFIGLEDMNYTGPIWADEDILFSKALDEIKKSKKPGFYYLTTVSTHGSYRFINDFGQSDYSQRLEVSIRRISDFIEKTLEIEPDSAILIIGDHKPALTRFFFENKILPKSLFFETGDRNEDFKFVSRPPREILGEMPAYFYHPDKAKAIEFAKKAANAPFYCLPSLFDEIFVGVDLPSFAFSREVGACSKLNTHDYYENLKIFPNYLYRLSLLN